jgi:signal transduction histidine kinase
LGATGGMALIVVLLAWNSTRQIIRPIRMLSESDRALARGDENAAEVPEEGLPQNELGDLVRQRNARVKEIFAYQRQLEERTGKLKETVAEMEDMSYSMIHDMRAPLRALASFGSVLLDEEADRLSPRGQEYLRRIKAASIRMDQFICDMLNYSLIARTELPLQPVNVSSVVQGILETYPAFEGLKGHIRVQPGLPIVHGNEAALTQCFSHLLDNAIKFVAPGQAPEVRVCGERIGERVRIYVEDNGVGIPPQMRERIFRIFERGSNAGDSTGIGLAIARKAVERMGGRVGVISEPGYGSRFWVELQSAS